MKSKPGFVEADIFYCFHSYDINWISASDVKYNFCTDIIDETVRLAYLDQNRES